MSNTHETHGGAGATGGVDPTPPDPGAKEDHERQRAELHAKPGITIWIELGKGGEKRAIAFKIAESELHDEKLVDQRIRAMLRQAEEQAIAKARELLATKPAEK